MRSVVHGAWPYAAARVWVGERVRAVRGCAKLWPTPPTGRCAAAVFEYIEVWYNRERLHSNLGYLSSVAYELQLAAQTDFTKTA